MYQYIKSKLNKDIIFLLLISTAFFILMAQDLNSWYYSAIGDEYAFFNFAAALTYNQTLLSLLPKAGHQSLFSQNGVYQITPILSSAYQAIIMKLFGINHTGWIISSILIVIASFCFLYFLVKDWFGRKVAVISLAIFASSHYLWAFTHLGYWNINVFFPLVSAFFFFFRGLKQKQILLMLLAGLFASLGFYAYYSARITIVLLIIFILFNLKKLRHQKTLLLAFTLGFILLFLPFILVNQQTFWQRMYERSLVGTGEIADNQRLLFIVKNLRGSLSAFYHNPQVSHFVSGSLIDPITAIFFTLGLLLMLFAWRQYYFFLIWFIAILVGAGGFSPYPYPPITRLFFLLPVIALISSLALIRIVKSKTIIISLLIFIFLFNLYRFYVKTPSLMQLTPEAVIVRALQEDCRHQQTLIIHPKPKPLLQPILNSFQFKPKPQTIKPDNVNSRNLNQYDCFVFVKKPVGLPVKTITDLSGKTKIFIYRN